MCRGLSKKEYKVGIKRLTVDESHYPVGNHCFNDMDNIIEEILPKRKQNRREKSKTIRKNAQDLVPVMQMANKTWVIYQQK